MRVCILADNQYITSEGIRSVLKKQGIDIFLRARTIKELQEKLRDSPTAIVVLDYTLFDFASMQQMLIVKAAAVESSWLLFSNELGEVFLRHVVLSDPTLSVVMKTDPKEELDAAVERLILDAPFLSESVEHILDGDTPPADDEPVKLTASEKLILHEIAKGKTTKEIAYEKNLSFHTVNSHRKNIFRKLGVNSLHEAIRYAIRAGIFDIAEYYI
ncbi:MAG: response regulator transcription factor [Tannerella sp.]|jgi:DNA-binding NarL/FixJ family response regulator|nr:response regulator transcription factor [Tannerella sp.]